MLFGSRMDVAYATVLHDSILSHAIRLKILLHSMLFALRKFSFVNFLDALVCWCVLFLDLVVINLPDLITKEGIT